MRPNQLGLIAAAIALCFCSACAEKPQAKTQAAAREQTSPVGGETKSAASSGPSARAGLETAAHIDSARAMRYTAQIVGIGPRPIGSEGHRKLEDYLGSHLKADSKEVGVDEFTAQTPAGNFTMRNFVAKFPGKRDGIIVIASHYDTLYSLPGFVGANDGGSSTGLLLELADQLRTQKQREGYSVWLVFFDGEEAVKQWTASDSLYGSRHLAQKWQSTGTAKKIKALLLADMIGDADLNIENDQSSTPWLEDMVYQAATNLGYQSHFFARSNAYADDHVPFIKAGVPAADLIDFDYGYNNALWHTTQDTLDKLSPKSLQISGDVILETVRLLDQK